MQRTVVSVSALLGGVASALILAGCAAGPPAPSASSAPAPTPAPTTSVARSDSAGEPPGWDALMGDHASPIAAISTDRATLTVVLFGSSSCVPTPVAIAAPTTSRLSVRFELLPEDGSDPATRACTADLAPHTWLFDVPNGFDYSGNSRLAVSTRDASVPRERTVVIPIQEAPDS